MKRKRGKRRRTARNVKRGQLFVSETTDESGKSDEDNLDCEFVYHRPTYMSVEREEGEVEMKGNGEELGPSRSSVFKFKAQFERICKKLDMSLANELYQEMSKEQMEVSCGCSATFGCSNKRCSCFKAGMLCSVLCKCRGCKNLHSNLKAF